MLPWDPVTRYVTALPRSRQRTGVVSRRLLGNPASRVVRFWADTAEVGSFRQIWTQRLHSKHSLLWQAAWTRSTTHPTSAVGTHRRPVVVIDFGGQYAR